MSDSPGDELHLLQARVAGRYSIDREIGRGGMGIVYLARDVSLDRRVAIKLLPREFTAQASLRERFMREARIAAKLSHPNIVPVYSVEEHPDAVYYAMGFIEGESVAERIARVGQLAPAEVATIVQQVAWALAYAHGNGVVHRDIKPDNILLEQGTGRAWVMDFGIARALGGTPGERPNTTKLTQMGHVVGTAAYMSPEQAAGEDVDGRSDLYSLGIVAYFALTGKLPIDATSAQALLAKQLTEVPAPVASVRPGIPAALATAVDKLLAKDPAARFATGEELADAIGVTEGVAAEIPPPLRAFLRAVETNFSVSTRFVLVAAAIAATRPSAALAIIMAGAGTMAGSFAEMVFRIRRLSKVGYRWADLRDAITLDVVAREEERRALATVLEPGALRVAGLRALLSVATGIAGFVFAIYLAQQLKGNTAAWALPVAITEIVIGGLFLIVCVTPLAYFVAMRRSQQALSKPRTTASPALRWLASGTGAWVYRMASRNIAPAPARGAAAALDQLLSEVEDSAPRSDKAKVVAVRARVAALWTESDALRARERELNRAIAEAGAGTVADQIGAARAAVPPQLERIAATLEAIRLKLLLVRSGVSPASDLTELTRTP